jgi:hypothetical protein
MYYIVYNSLYLEVMDMAKKIKSFTVDGETYAELISMFKKYKADVSLSYQVDRCLKNLLKELKDMEEGHQRGKFTVPMSYVIGEMMKPTLPELEEVPDDFYVPEDDNEISPEEIIDHTLQDFEETYEAERRRIPRNIYRFVRRGYELTRDRKYLIHKTLGTKLVIEGNEVRELNAEESKETEG